MSAHNPPDAGFDADPVAIERPEYPAVQDRGVVRKDLAFGRLQDVHVNVTAELGRVTMSIGELLQLGEGSVVELDRNCSAPIDLMVDGVRLATGDVVVVEDHFAVRIRQIESTNGEEE